MTKEQKDELASAEKVLAWLQDGKDIRFGEWTQKDVDWLNSSNVRGAPALAAPGAGAVLRLGWHDAPCSAAPADGARRGSSAPTPPPQFKRASQPHPPHPPTRNTPPTPPHPPSCSS